jgi:hypothetical protein
MKDKFKYIIENIAQKFCECAEKILSLHKILKIVQ